MSKKRNKRVSQSELLRRQKQSKRDYQINNIDKIYKEEERKRKDWIEKQNMQWETE